MQRRTFLQTLTSLLGLTQASPANIQPVTLKKIQIEPQPPNKFKKSPTPNHHHYTPSDSWQRLPLVPLPDELDAYICIPAPQRHHGMTLASAIHTATPVTITYHGGTDPGKPRTLLPTLLFQKSPDHRLRPGLPAYLLAWCQTRQAPRTFRLDRIQKITIPSHPTKPSPSTNHPS